MKHNPVENLVMSLLVMLFVILVFILAKDVPGWAIYISAILTFLTSMILFELLDMRYRS